MLDAAYPYGACNYWKSSFLRELSNDAIDVLVDQYEDCPSPQTAIVLEHLHGAATRVALDRSAYPHREPGFNFLVTSVWTDPAASDENVEWTRRVHSVLAPFLSDRRYLNFLRAGRPRRRHRERRLRAEPHPARGAHVSLRPVRPLPPRAHALGVAVRGVNRAHGLDRVRLGRRLVLPVAPDPREAERHAARVLGAFVARRRTRPRPRARVGGGRCDPRARARA